MRHPDLPAATSLRPTWSIRRWGSSTAVVTCRASARAAVVHPPLIRLPTPSVQCGWSGRYLCKCQSATRLWPAQRGGRLPEPAQGLSSRWLRARIPWRRCESPTSARASEVLRAVATLTRRSGGSWPSWPTELSRDTLVIFTSDHGTNLCDRPCPGVQLLRSVLARASHHARPWAPSQSHGDLRLGD